VVYFSPFLVHCVKTNLATLRQAGRKATTGLTSCPAIGRFFRNGPKKNWLLPFGSGFSAAQAVIQKWLHGSCIDSWNTISEIFGAQWHEKMARKNGAKSAKKNSARIF
jgi:hypothetical protein